MKGIVLAGGSGTRLLPITKTVCKQLLPIYDKPMICYPLSVLMLLDIKDILIISTPKDTPLIEEYLGNGSDYGLNLNYKVQKEPKGIAEAFLLGAEFIGNDSCCLILGDNIFYTNQLQEKFLKHTKTKDGAVVLGYHVHDPERFGVIEFDEDKNVLSLEEKPSQPKSPYAAVGLYFYDKTVVERAKKLAPSKRGELEITDLNKKYLEEGKLKADILSRGAAWLDAGTPQSMLEASNFISLLDRRQGLKIACLEEISLRQGFINDKQFEVLKLQYPKSSEYRTYLERIQTEIGKN